MQCMGGTLVSVIGCSLLLIWSILCPYQISASRVAVYIYFEPVVAIILGVTLLGERPSWQTLCGAVVIGASVAIVNMLKR